MTLIRPKYSMIKRGLKFQHEGHLLRANLSQVPVAENYLAMLISRNRTLISLKSKAH